MDINYKDIKLGVIGCGKMASAILGGVVKNDFLLNNNIYVYDKFPEVSHKLADIYKFNVCDSIEELLAKVDTILLATKPFVVDEVLTEIKKYYNNQLVLSILAGVKIKKYVSNIPNIKIVRIMPNTPALVNMGMSAICPRGGMDNKDADFAYNFMKNCGEVVRVNEEKIDIITALSGSGPAFYYKVIELMAKSAAKLGLNYEDAILLSSQTALGSAKMVLENNFDTETLIKNVTTPGGCTEVGNNILNNSDIDKIFDKVIADTTQKAIDLG